MQDCIEYLFDPSMPAQGTWTRQGSKCTLPDPGSSSRGGFCGSGEQSMWPEVDAHALKVWNSKGGCPGGKVGKVLQPDGGGRIVLCLLGNKWCEAVGRHHKSNGVMLIVDTSRGVFYQKCYDPDCRAASKRSQDYPLPPHIIPPEWRSEEEQREDAAMLRAMEEFERNQALAVGAPKAATASAVTAHDRASARESASRLDVPGLLPPSLSSVALEATSGNLNCGIGACGAGWIAKTEDEEDEEWGEDVLAAADAAVLQWQKSHDEQASQGHDEPAS